VKAPKEIFLDGRFESTQAGGYLLDEWGNLRSGGYDPFEEGRVNGEREGQKLREAETMSVGSPRVRVVPLRPPGPPGKTCEVSGELFDDLLFSPESEQFGEFGRGTVKELEDPLSLTTRTGPPGPATREHPGHGTPEPGVTLRGRHRLEQGGPHQLTGEVVTTGLVRESSLESRTRARVPNLVDTVVGAQG
jgi:hypothetical protein